RDKSSKDLAAPALPGQIPTIYLRGGTYFLPEPLVLTPQDSQLALSAYRGEHPVLSGGRRISGWRQAMVNGKACWLADIPEARDGRWTFHELWINGKRATRARHPNHGYLHIAGLPDKSKEWTEGMTRFQFHEG